LQESTLRRGVDVVVGTPGRIKDLMTRGSLKLDSIRCVPTPNQINFLIEV